MNWGKSIVVVLTLFIGFIMYFVINMTTHRSSRHDLVTEKYYQQELLLNDKMQAERNMKMLSEEIKVENFAGGLHILFPQEFNSGKVSGKVFLYRPSNKVLDFEEEILLENLQMTIDKEKLIQGRWNIILSFKHNKKEYLFTKEIVY